MEGKSRHTPLYDELKKRGGRMVPFAGYEMPVQFEGIVAEHTATRTRAGLFDLTHMGEIWLEGPDALASADRLVTNNVFGVDDGGIVYSPMCLSTGGVVDDLLVYRFSDERVLMVVNAVNHDKDLDHIQQNLKGNVKAVDRSYETGQLALQGPLAKTIMAEIASPSIAQLSSFRFIEGEIAGQPCLVSRTGYTAEDGYEIYCENQYMKSIFDVLVEAGSPHGLALVGLGARDTLRLEGKLLLYGNDMDETTTPLEASLGWTVKLDAGDFIGRDALVAQKERGLKRRLMGFEMLERAIARENYPVIEDGAGADSDPIGRVTSGRPSPTLGKNIGLAYLPKKGYKRGAVFGVKVRKKVARAKVVKTPFYKRSE